MIAGGSFAVGTRFVLDETRHKVHRDLGGGQLVVENLSTGCFVDMQFPALLGEWKQGRLTIGEEVQKSFVARGPKESAVHASFQEAFLQSYPPDLVAKAKTKLLYVTRLMNTARTLEVMKPLIEEIFGDKRLWKDAWVCKQAPHFTTVVKWINRYLDSGRDIRALIDQVHHQGNKKGRFPDAVLRIVDDVIETQYLTLERPTIQTVLKVMCGLVARVNLTRLPSEQLPKPTYGFLKRRIGALNDYEKTVARYGHQTAHLRFRTAGMGALALKPLSRVCMDHTRMDVFVVDEVTGLPLGRPWLTLVLDENTRYVLGFYLGFEDPSALSMSRALRHALMPKDAIQGAQNGWDAWGLFELLIVDNGLEFHGKVLEEGAGRFGISIQFCPRKMAWYKGKIERFFGTMGTGLLDGLKGRTFSHIDLKGDYDPAKHAVMSLGTLKRVVSIWIVDIYHQETNRTLKMSPAQAWKERIVDVDRYLPPSSLSLESAFSMTSKRRLTHKGIEFDSLFYNCQALRVIREEHGHDMEVEVRTYDDDLGSLIVVSPDGQQLIKVPAIDTAYANGLTRWQHKVCKQYKQRLENDNARFVSLFQAREHIRALIAADMQTNSRKTRKRQTRFTESHVPTTEQSSSAPSPVPAPVAAEVCGPSDTATSTVPSSSHEEDVVPEFSSRRKNTPNAYQEAA